MERQDRAKQGSAGRAGQCSTGLGRARLVTHKAGQGTGRVRQGKVRLGKAGQGRAGQGCA